MTRSNRLLRLFPRNWRARYGVEFSALLETSPLTPRNILGIVRLAAGEWALRTATGRVIIGLALPAAALVCAMALGAAIPVSPVITEQGGQTLVAPPRFPGLLGLFFHVLFFASIYRFMSRAFGFSSSRAPMSAREFSVWLLALFVTSVFAQWGDLVAWLGTGVEPSSSFAIWGHQAIYVNVALMNLLAADRQSQLESANTLTARASRPLGLR